MILVLLVGYLLLAWAAGLALTFVSRMPWQLEGRLATGLVLGLSAAAMLTWIAAVPIGMSGLAVGVGAVLLAAVLAACVRLCHWRETLRTEVAAAGLRWRSKAVFPLLAVLVPALVFFVPFYGHAMEYRAAGSVVPGSAAGLYAGYVNIWGDWSTHLSLAGYLSTARGLMPPQNPFFAGTNLTYSFLPDLFSGMLTHLGLTLPQSLALVSAMLSVALVVVFHSTALRLTGKAWAATAGTLIFFLSGGLGFWRILGEVKPQGIGPIYWLHGLLTLIVSPPHEYTLDRAIGYQWLNPVLAYVVPQRTVLFGWALGLLVLSLLWYAWTNALRREMVVAGVVLGLLPLFHIGTYVDLGIFSAGLLVLSFTAGGYRRRRASAAGPGALAASPVREGAAVDAPSFFAGLWRRFDGWFLYGVAALGLGVPQALLILPQAAYSHHFLDLRHPVWGWMAADPDGHYRLPWLWFWILNTGPLIPLAVATIAGVAWGKPRMVRFLLPAWLLFIIPNVYQLAPWIWDNTKYFAWWAMPAAMLAGLAVHQLMRRGPATWIAGALLMVIAVASGAIDLGHAAQPRLNEPNLLFLDRDALAVASWAERSTPETAVFLTGSRHNAPILTLSRRAVVEGYTGWLWSWGIDYRPRDNDVRVMLTGGDGVTSLMRHYHVAYVVIGPTELADYSANNTYFEQHYPVAYRSPDREYQVYKIG